MIDREQERRVWQRVYAQPQTPRGKIDRALLTLCYRRAKANLAVFERHTSHPVYGDAFERLASQTQEHCKMLGRMLER